MPYQTDIMSICINKINGFNVMKHKWCIIIKRVKL